MHRTGFLCALFIAVLTACSTPDEPTATPSAEATPAQAAAQNAATQPSPAAQPDEPTATPSAEAVTITDTDEALVLTVWRTDALLAAENEVGQAAFTEELSEFDESFPNIQVDIRTKRVEGPGGILDYLRTAPPVAPAVMPDVILINRPGLTRALGDELIVPFGQVPGGEALGMGFYPVAEELATVNGTLTGIPYVLTTDHAVYRTTLFTDVVPNQFSVLLEQEAETPIPFTFAAGPVTGVSRTLLTQYLAAGGTLTDEEGNLTLDADPLTDVLTFYAEANELGIINPAVFQYATGDEVWGQYLTGQASLATVPARRYLLERDEVRTTGLTTIPTTTGEPNALIEGLYWAIVTRDPERQAAAVTLVDFLLDPINQGEFTQAAGWLPSQPAAMIVWGSDDPYTAFGGTLLEGGTPLPEPSVRSSAGDALQEALEAVLLNGVLPAQAANAAVATITGEEGN
jgi:ABC-type glycerol-3-phosphate transport system substrate-binding protein